MARTSEHEGFLKPVNYARNLEKYRPPPRAYSRLTRRIGPVATFLRLTPGDVITVEVPGRRSGVTRRTTLVRAECDSQHYVVSLAGESDWVRNVRAAGGRAVIAGRHRRTARLTEVAPPQRAAVIRAYLLRWDRPPGSRAVAREARYYFGVSPDASLAELAQVAEYHPVFRIEYLTGPEEVAPGVYRVAMGHGLTQVNAYLVRSEAGWVVIDAGWPGHGQAIRAAAELVFGPGARPEAVLLTHIHPDHSGSALDLARQWDLPVYVHPDELVLAPGGYLPEYASPLDRWLVAPLLRLLPRRAVEASRSRSSLEGTARAFDPGAGIPGLPGWQAIPAPGHTPGHVAFFRAADRVLITGDAVLTVNVNSVPDLLAGQHRAAAPPYVSTWNWPEATRSVAVLASLKPSVLACGHGLPMTGPAASASLTALAASLHQPASPVLLRPASATTQTPIAPPGISWRRTARASCTATAQERAMRVPGDDLVPDPVVQTTQAVTIGAPPNQVWPWLVQTGQGRAGFYSDSKFWNRCVDWYYRLLARGQPGQAQVGYHIAADDRIVADWQNPQPGDIISDGPPGTARYVVRQADQARSFVLFTDTHLRYLVPARLRDDPRLSITGEISDSFYLTEPTPGTTRLIRRMRLTCAPWPFRLYAVPIVLIWGEVITARNLLRGIKRRVEAGTPAQLPDRRRASGPPDASQAARI